MPREANKGKIDRATVPLAVTKMTPEEKRMKAAREALPPMQAVLNLVEMEVCRQEWLANADLRLR